MRRARIATAILVAGVLVVSAFLVYAFFLSPASIEHPAAPPAVTAARRLWDYDILLPTYVPTCVRYDSGGTGIVPDDAAINGVALQVTLTANDTAGCSAAGGSVIRISEAPSFESLTGNVSTVTHGRMQFAGVSQSTSDGRTVVTLQWRCLSMMCRVTGTTSVGVTQNDLARMADSFQITRSST
jgi:hypothetical protein